MTCHSGGTLEIYVEPHLPAPVLWVAGTTPIAGALAALGAAAGWRVTLIDPVADADAFPGAERVVDGRPTCAARPGLAPYVVVATQGVWDEEAIAAALARDASYVGLVASPTRAGVVRAWLRDEAGLAEERLAALRAPAGIDLGAETPEEIALSILAELVQVRRGRADFVAAPGPATSPAARPRAGRAAAGRRRHRPARSGLRHDRRPRRTPGTSPSTTASSTRSVRSAAGLASSRSRPPTSPPRYRCPTDADRPATPHPGGLHALRRLRSDPAPAARRSGPSSSTRTRSGQCGPGVEKIEVVDDTHFKAAAKVGIGFISAKFNVDMTFAELVAPDKAVIKAHGQAPGSAVDADAEMHLSDGPDGTTVMDWKADVNIAGTLAGVGARLIEGTANKMIGQTFDCMRAKLEAGTDVARPAMERLSRVVGPVATNVHILADPGSREAIAIDTATPSLAWIADELAARDWTLKLIVSTHGHWDHIGDNAAVANHTGADIAVHPSTGSGWSTRNRSGRRSRSCHPFRRSISPRVGSCASARSGCGSCTRPATRRVRCASWSRTRASSTAATRSSPARGAGSTCPAAMRSRWSPPSRG